MAQLNDTLRSSNTLRSATRFALVGVMGTLIDFGLFLVLNLQIGIPALLANTLSYSAGIVNNFCLHRYWTYAQRSSVAPMRQFLQFMGVSLSALALNNLIVLLLAPAFRALFIDQSLGVLGAKILAIAVGMFWNFFANHLWTFRNRQN